MRLSVLDQSTIASGRTADQAIRETLALARHCDALGYHRYWMAEHHNTPSQAGTAPEVLSAAIAITTQRIRVGTAGVMLPHYSALKVAEQFRVLEAIAPGRIDMGLGRAPGSDGLTAHALNPNAARAADNFPAQVRDLFAWVSGEALPDQHPFRSIIANPAGPTSPEPWILGSSDYGAQLAAHFGVPYGFAHFITDGHGCADALEIYRTGYRPSARFPKPIAQITVWAMCADTEEEAERQFNARAIARIWRDRGIYRPVLSPEEAEAALADLTPMEQNRLERLRATALYGTKGRLGARLRALAEELRIDEIGVLTTMHDPKLRQRSYALLAEEFGLGANAA